HLLLIGGPTDVVVEQDIRLAQPRRPAAQTRAPEAPAQRLRPAGPLPPRPPQAPRAQEEPDQAPRPGQRTPPQPAKNTPAPPQHPSAPAPQHGGANEGSPNEDKPQAAPTSADEVMAKPLGELSTHKRPTPRGSKFRKDPAPQRLAPPRPESLSIAKIEQSRRLDGRTPTSQSSR